LLILAARTGPRPLVACHVPGKDTWCHPRFFGITSPSAGLRALVCEVLTEDPAALGGRPAFGTILRYTLLTPARTAQMITSWVRLIADGRRRAGPPAVSLFAHRGLAALKRERFQISPDGDTFTVTRTCPGEDTGPAATLDETGTTMQLTSALTRMAS
jgi:hypothetical protein